MNVDEGSDLTSSFVGYISMGVYKRHLSTVKPVLSGHSKRSLGFQDRLSLNAGQKYCSRMLRGEHSALLSTCIKLPFVIKIFE